ncbi:MAG TPA: ATP-binding protein [Caulobacteraceae bacterium]|jgi:two-component system, sensor histidine kinase
MGASHTGEPEHSGDLEAAAWVFENSVDVFLVIEDGCVARANPAWTGLTGWTAAETEGRPPSDFIHADDWPAVQSAARTLAPGQEYHVDHRLLTKTRGPVWVAACTKRAAGGAGLVVLRDITEQRGQAADREDVKRTGELLHEAIGLTLWRYDPERRIYDMDSDISRPIGASGGLSVETAAGVTAIIHPDDVTRVTEAFLASIATGETGGSEYRQKNDDGRWARCRVAWRGIRPTAAGPWQMIGVTQDVTELADARDEALREKQAAQSAADAKAEFLANMSHEIRTPMNGVLGVLHLLKDEPLSSDGRRLLDEALACGSMLATLLNDVIDFSKVEAGRLELAPEALNPEAALEGVANLLRPQAEERGLWLRTMIAPGVGWVSVDPVRLRQMLFNLIGNAVKFTLDGGVEVRLTAIGGGPQKRLRVEIEDTGIGIAQEAQQTLFQRFQQADSSTTRRFGGSGLGLVITRRLAELMDGEVGLRSQEGQGSTFWFEIAAPLAEPDIAAQAQAPSDGWLNGMRILIVEDNATNRLIASRMLESLGASVQTANDGAAGVEVASREPFDLILMDVQMPVMDGVSATRAIRRLPAPAGAVPIVAMTANVFNHQQQSYVEAGMTGAVSKPLSPARLLAEINRIVGSDDAQGDVAAAVA